MWKQRDLTMIGRIQIVKTFIISQFTYVCSAVHIPENYVVELNNLEREKRSFEKENHDSSCKQWRFKGPRHKSITEGG